MPVLRRPQFHCGSVHGVHLRPELTIILILYRTTTDCLPPPNLFFFHNPPSTLASIYYIKRIQLQRQKNLLKNDTSEILRYLQNHPFITHINRRPTIRLQTAGIQTESRIGLQEQERSFTCAPESTWTFESNAEIDE